MAKFLIFREKKNRDSILNVEVQDDTVLIQKFASRQLGHILLLICLVFSSSDKPLSMPTKRQLT